MIWVYSGLHILRMTNISFDICIHRSKANHSSVFISIKQVTSAASG
ncbi:hypothetical protein D1BOALGB6SA_7962 [Olavius sp. associated proteobacterium Delta 1]|nr:hypothetical protein D1BOALGB6SA_7962 [Olavius sp. associated proteobacterium Delta 1]